MKEIIISLSIILVLPLVVWLMLWLIHRGMNIDECKPYDYVNFKTFIREFEKYKNDPNLTCNCRSIFLSKDDMEILFLCADVVRIDNKCMIFYPLDYIKYKIWIRKNGAHRIKGLWDKE